MSYRQLVTPPIVLGPPGAAPSGYANYAPPAIRIYNSTGPVTGVRQSETATAAGTASATGAAEVTVTSALFAAPVVVQVPITSGDTAAVIAGKIREVLGSNETILAHYSVRGSSTTINLYANRDADNDTTLNIAIATGTATGVTPAPTSTNTTPGVLGTPGFLGQEAHYEVNAAVGSVWKCVLQNPPTWRAMYFISA